MLIEATVSSLPSIVPRQESLGPTTRWPPFSCASKFTFLGLMSGLTGPLGAAALAAEFPIETFGTSGRPARHSLRGAI